MIRRILGTLLVLLGLAAAAFGVATATIWRPADMEIATMPEPESPVVLVEPGVLGLVAETVTVKATASDEDLPVILAFAPSTDVEAWVDGAAATRVTGLATWEELAIEVTEGDSSVPDPAGADLWRDQLTGEGELVVDITPDPGQVTLLAATDGTAPAPALTLSWPVEVSTPYLIPLLIAGGVLLLLGIGVLAYDQARRHTVRAQEESREKSGRIAAANVTDTAAIPVTEDMPEGRLTRRQLRELERKRRAKDPRLGVDGAVSTSGGAIGAGVVPGVVNPERFRALRHVEDVPGSPDARFAPDADGGSRDSGTESMGTELTAPIETDPTESESIETEPTSAEPTESEPTSAQETLSREDALEAAGHTAGAGIIPDSLAAAHERAEADRHAAGQAVGAGIVPDSLAAAHERAEADRQAAGHAAGAGIVPPREGAAAAEPEPHHDDETTPEQGDDAGDIDLPTDGVTWRDLWGFRRKPGSTEDQR